MKNKITTVMSVLTVLLVVLCTTGPASAGPLARPNLQGGAPTVVSYQGQVIADGSPYNGIGYFMFAIIDADENVYWTNDGQEPAAGVSLTVTDGLFNVLLGDTDLPNMTALPAGAFDEPERYLRVWFSTDSSGYLLLAPDRRIAAVPYALQAEEAAYAADADQLDGQHGSYYQARVSGVCAAGSTVRAINADGTVVCQAGALNRAIAPTGNADIVVDNAGDVGMYTSVTIGTDGLPLISYHDVDNGTLKMAHCEDLVCTSAISTVLTIGGLYNSVVIGADGLPLISFYDDTNGDLKVVHCEDAACTTKPVVNTLDGSGTTDVGMYTSLTIGIDGLPLISYHDVTNDMLKVAHCDDLTCTSTTSTTLYTGGLYTSVTIGIDGLPLISFYENYYHRLYVARCDDVACTSADVNMVDSDGDVGMYTSVIIGTDGLPLISYYNNTNGRLKVVHCEDLACTSFTHSDLDSGGLYTSATIGADGLPLISYYDDNVTYNNLKVAHCRDLACTSAFVTTLDSNGDVGEYSSVTIGADGLPLISYYDHTNGSLKVFHCASPFCTPYFRRR